MKSCFNALSCYADALEIVPRGCGICKGIVEDNVILSQCAVCKDMNQEILGYIEAKMCVACVHFHWGMGEMGVCDLREYRDFNDIGEWSDVCCIDKFEFKRT